MKKSLLLLFVILLKFSLVAQTTVSDRLEEISRLQGYTVTQLDENWVRIDYPNGKSLIKSIVEYNGTIQNKPVRAVDTTIISLLNADSSAYYHKYTLWREVPIHNWEYDHIEVGDVNLDSRPELYGSRKVYTSDIEPVSIYEFNEFDELVFVHQYDTAKKVDAIYDLDKNQLDEIMLGVSGPVFPREHRVYSAENDTSLALIRDFTFLPFTSSSQASDITMLDFDRDEFTDLIIIQSLQPKVYVFEYDPAVNNFVQRFVFDTGEEPPYSTSGFSIGDFDLDGFKEIGFGTGQAHIYIIENQGNDQYTGTWQDSAGSSAAYHHTEANDLDGNGKPEFIVMSDHYYNGIPSMLISIYEATNNDNYHQVGVIVLVGGGSWLAGTLQNVDIENDGTDEIAVCIDNRFLLLKFTGSKNYHQYEIDFLKLNEAGALPNESSSYFGAIVSDLFGNGQKYILISMDHSINTGGNHIFKRMTRIYKPDISTEIQDLETNVKESFNLFQNYPNPFNSSTKISYSKKEDGFVSIKVYDNLGTEVRTLVSETQPAGFYEVDFNATELPSGMYIYTIRSNENVQTKKMILLK